MPWQQAGQVSARSAGGARPSDSTREAWLEAGPMPTNNVPATATATTTSTGTTMQAAPRHSPESTQPPPTYRMGRLELRMASATA